MTGDDIEGVDIHALRYTYGTMLAADPRNDLRTVMSLMRHRTIAMTMQLHVRPRAFRLREALLSLDLDNRGKDEAKAVLPVSQAAGM